MGVHRDGVHVIKNASISRKRRYCSYC